MKILEKNTWGMGEIKLEGNSRSMGRKHGEVLKEIIGFNLGIIENQNPNVWDGHTHIKVSQVVQGGAKFLKEFFPEYLEEMRGISEGSGFSMEKILRLNVLPFDWLGKFGLDECTQFAVRNARGQWILAKTRDLANNMIHVLFDRSPSEGRETLEVGVAGSILWPGSGLNENGVAIGSSGVWSKMMTVNYDEASTHFTLPSIHVLLELCKTVRECKNCIIERVPSLTGLNIVAVDQNDAIAYELSPDRLIELLPRKYDRFIARTNHYNSKELTYLSPSRTDNPSSYERESFLIRRLPNLRFNEDKELLRVISSHEGYPQNSICRHKLENGAGSETVYGSIANASEKRFTVFGGNPCRWLNL